jgi:VCBS repeat-containing protein
MNKQNSALSRLARLIAALALVLTLAGLNTHTARAASQTVTNTNDAGAGSLRQAIADAASGDTITFNLSGCPCTITLASQLVIDKTLTITGPGASTLTISGNNAVRAFSVPAGGNLNLSGVTIANGRPTDSNFGGAIFNLGTVTVSNSTFSNNTAIGASGAIDNTNGTLTVTGSTFTGNSALSGGAIENFQGTVTVTGSTFSGNRATSNDGGAIENFQGTVTVTGSTFTGNSAGGDGGALYNFFDSNMTVTGSTFTNNTAGGEGGGIYNDFDGLSLSNNRFIGNRPGGNCGGDVIAFSSDDGGNRSDDQTCDFFSVPNNIRLNPSSVAEELPAGTTVGTLSTLSRYNTSISGSFTYALVSGAGDTDNGSFTISGNTLKTAARFDYETKNSYSIRVQTTDDLGVTVVKNFTISVTDVVENRAPTAIALDPSSVAENQPSGTTVGTFATTDPDTGNTFTYSLVGGTGSTDNGSFTISGNTLTTAASFDYESKNSYSIRVRSTDNGGLFFEQVFTVSVSDVAENVAPVAKNDSYSTDEDTELTGNVLGNDTDDNGDTLTAIKLSDPQHGTLAFGSDGSFTYTPNANYNGADSFSYKANDGTADSNVAAVSITVNAVNDAPGATNNSYSTDEDTALTVSAPGVLANDSDPDGDALSAVLVNSPAHGMLTFGSDGSFTYTPNANYNGADSFSYKANDGTADSNVAAVSITVNAVNDAPVASGQSVSTAEDTAKNITLAANDVESSSLTYTVVSSPAHGTLSGTAPNLTYTPNANYSGPDSFTFKANDGTLDSNVATVNITVNAVNDAPTIAVAAGGACLADFKGQANLTISDLETAAGSLTLSASSSNTALVPNGNIAFGGSGANRTVTVATVSGKSGLATITIAVRDGTSSAATSIKIVVGGGSNDNLTGSAGADMLFGGNGNDTLQGGGGNDLLCGGNGDDSLYGSNGDDTLDAGSGNDRLYGEDGTDTLLGGKGDDALRGGDGNDTLRAGDGNDTLDGGGNNDGLYGENGNDTLTGGSGADRFDGGANNDTASDFNAGQGDTRVNIP